MKVQHLKDNKCTIHITHDDWVCDWGYEIIAILKEFKSTFIPTNKSWLTTEECLKAILKAEEIYFSSRIDLSNVKEPDLFSTNAPETQ